jgi:hypothetical protein
MRFIEKTYDETGDVVDVHEALQLFEEEYFKDALKLANAKKVQSKLAPPAPVPQPQRSGMRTLTNRDTAQMPIDRKQRALAAFHGTLR